MCHASWKVTWTAHSTRATLRMDVASSRISRCGSRHVLSRRRHSPGMNGRKHHRLRARASPCLRTPGNRFVDHIMHTLIQNDENIE